MSEVESGFFLIDKEVKWTSFDVVNKVRYTFKHERGVKLKIGHAGTLDPLATGLLILCYGKMTKEIYKFQDLKKEYTGIFQLGSTTASYDLETEVDQTFPTEHIKNEDIQRVVSEMKGKQMQRPPDFSAKRVNGKRAYELARKGEVVNVKENEIEIFEFKAELLKDNKVSFKIVCSKGTYIRSMAFEFGKKLESGAHLAELRRTAIGDYRVEKAMKMDELQDHFQMFSK